MTTASQMPMGWVEDRDEVARICGTLPTPIFGSNLPIAGSWDGKSSHWLWKGEEKVLGRLLPSWRQTAGTCVSQGYARGAQDLLLCDIAIRQEAEEWKGEEVATEPIYALSRVEIGGGRIRGDGSVGAWAAKAVMQYGLMFRRKYETGGKTYDLSKADDRIAVQWGSPGAGLPNALEPFAKEHPVKDTTMVTRADGIADALANYKAVPVCSMQGFTMKRDSEGFCRATGSWAHCMLIRGVFVLNGGKKAFAIQNSWGDYLDGTHNIETSDGEQVTLPEGCFLAEWDMVDKMARQEDTFILSEAVGFPRRSIDWTVIG
jgi:hypothetical protein